MASSTTRTARRPPARAASRGTRRPSRRVAVPADERLSQRADMIISTPELEAEWIESYASRHAQEAISMRSLPYHIEPADPPRAAPRSLRELCLLIAAKHFATHILPLGIETAAPGEEPSAPKDALGQAGAGCVLDRVRGSRKLPATESHPKRKRSALEYDSDADSDYREPESAPITTRPSRKSTRLVSDAPVRSATRRSIPRGLLPEEEDDLALCPVERLQRHWRIPATRSFWHFRNSYILRTETGGGLHSHLLKTLLRYAPEALTPHVVATYFVLGLEEVTLSSSMDAISKNPTGLPALLLSLILAKGSAIMNPTLAAAAAGDMDEVQEYLQSIATANDATSAGDGSRGTLPDEWNFGPPQAAGGRQVLASLRLRGLTRLSTGTVKGFFTKYPAGSHLTTVHLAGCVGVGPSAIKAMVASCGPHLRSVSVESTDVGAAGFEALLSGCPRLEVLKAGRVEGLGDAPMQALLDRVEQAANDATVPFKPLAYLHTLKLSGTEVGDAGVARLIRLCAATLTNLSLSNTHVAPKGDFHALGLALGLPGYEAEGSSGSPRRAPIRKLALSRLHLELESWRAFISALCSPFEQEDAANTSVDAGPSLRGTGPKQPANAGHGPGMADGMLDTIVLESMVAVEKRVARPGGLSQDALLALTEALHPILSERARRSSQQRGVPLMERIDLSFNPGLESETHGGWGAVLPSDPNWRPEQEQGSPQRGGPARGYAYVPEGAILMMRTTLGRFVAEVGRYTRRLVLNGVALGRSDLLFDAPESELGPCSTQVLSLAQTNVPDEALAGIAGPRGCRSLTHLNLESSGIEEETAMKIVQLNPFLESLDLTQCRAIPRNERRTFFEVCAAHLP